MVSEEEKTVKEPDGWAGERMGTSRSCGKMRGKKHFCLFNGKKIRIYLMKKH